MDLKTQRPLSRPSYGSFTTRAATSTSINSTGISSTSSSFYIPQSIPEHQLVSQFTSPVATAVSNARRGLVDEYVEAPRTALARTRALVQRSEDTQTALKQVLQSDQRRVALRALSTTNLATRTSSTWTRLDSDGRQQLQPLLLPPRAHEESNPQEDSDEHNYWMQELARRRAGLRRSRRRSCLAARTTTSPLRVGVVMCSVPLVLVVGFVVFMVLFGQALDASSGGSRSSVRSRGVVEMMEMEIESREWREARVFAAAGGTRKTRESGALADEGPEEKEVVDPTLSEVASELSRLRGARKDSVVAVH